jgi:peptidyl-prolyl cis-trans isomerase B (cyclophilin B)
MFIRFSLVLVALTLLFSGCVEEKEKKQEMEKEEPAAKDTTEISKQPKEITGNELAVIKMKDGGEIVIKFYYDDASKTVENFIKLARKGFYDKLTFHRIIPGFMVQGGDPMGTGMGNAGYTIDAEFNDHQFKRGTLGMARGPDPNSASCQFFICLTRQKCQHLDGNYTAFGEVIKGMGVVDKIAQVKTGENDKPVEPVIMESVKIQLPKEE